MAEQLPRRRISYPVPLEDALAVLYLPPDLTADEAERIKRIIDTLVIIPAATEPGEPGD